MCAYRPDIERELKAARLKLDDLVEGFQNAGGARAANFFTLISEINSQRQTIAAMEQRINAIGKPRKDFPEFVNINQYRKP